MVMRIAFSPPEQHGFTLIELMAAVAILIVVALLAVPSFSRFREATRIRTETTRLMSDVVLARSEAIKRNRQVSLCPASVGAEGELECGGLLADGWIIFEDSNRDASLNAGEVLIRRGRAVLPGLGVSNRLATREADSAIRYQPDGTARRNMTLMVCSRAYPDIASWSVVLNLVGRPRMAYDWGNCA